MLLAVALVLVLGAAAVFVWLTARAGEDPPGGDGAGNTASGQTSEVGESITPAEAAYQSLPRATALPDTTMVVSLDVDGNTDLYLVDAATGERTARLTDAPGIDLGPVLAPDRSTVVYLRDTDEGYELRALAVDGSGDRPLFSEPLPDCRTPMRPAWNPVDPTQVAIACHDDPDATSLRLVTLDGRVVRDLRPGQAVADDLTFSADGTRILYWGGPPGTGAGDLYTLAVDGASDPRRLTDGGADNDAVWSPDGESVAFARTVGAGAREIHVMNADGSDIRSVTSGGYVDQGPSWSPDGAMIAFKSNRPASDGVSGDHLWVVDPADRGARELEAGGLVVSSPTWGHR